MSISGPEYIFNMGTLFFFKQRVCHGLNNQVCLS